MKKLLKLTYTSFLFCLLFIALAIPSFGQDRGHKKARLSPNASVSQTIGTHKITVTYGRPGIKGRNVFGGLVSYGKWWRTGANESTVIVIPTDVTVEGKPLKAGTYSLYTIPEQKKWTIIFNKKLSWGTQYDKSKDVLRVDAKPESASKMQQLLIYFQHITDHSADLMIHWDTTKVPVTIKI